MTVCPTHWVNALRVTADKAVRRARLAWALAVVAAFVCLVWSGAGVVAGSVAYGLAAVALIEACRGFGVRSGSAWMPMVVLLACECLGLIFRGVIPTTLESNLAPTVLMTITIARLASERAGNWTAVSNGVIGSSVTLAVATRLIMLSSTRVDKVELFITLGAGLKVLALAVLGYVLLARKCFRIPALRLLMIGVASRLAIDVFLMAWGQRLPELNNVATFVRLVPLLALVAGALHHSMTGVGGRTKPSIKLPWWWMVVFGLSGLVPASLVVFGRSVGRSNDTTLGIFGLVALLALVFKMALETRARAADQRNEASFHASLAGLLVATDHTTLELAAGLVVRGAMGGSATDARLHVLTPERAESYRHCESTLCSASTVAEVPPAIANLLSWKPDGWARTWRMVPTMQGESYLFSVATVVAPSEIQLTYISHLADQLGLALDRMSTSDMTYRRHAERRLAALVTKASDVITLVNTDLVVVYQSPSVTAMLGWDANEVLHVSLLGWFAPDEVEGVEAVLRELAMGKRQSVRHLETRLRQSGGAWRDVDIVATNLLDDPDVGGIVLNIRDVSERRQLQQQLMVQALHDPLTGLANRGLLVDRTEHALQATLRGGPGPAVMFLDLDNFKMINDSLGHQAGDRLLIEVAKRLEASLRPGDTAARLGGDEFALLLANCGELDPSVLRDAGPRVFDAISEPLLLEGVEISPRASIGVAAVGASANSTKHESADLLRNADLAMYVAKSNGGGVKLYDSSMHDNRRRRLHLQAELGRALERQEFEVHFQPIVALQESGVALDPMSLFSRPAIIGVEALVRWRHPQRGMVGPMEFIGPLEETGQIVQLGRWVLLEACHCVASWARGGLVDELSLTVNVSARQLQDPSLLDDVAWAIHHSGLDPTWLCIEVTESVVMRDSKASVERLQALKQLGVRIAIDDFGTGYSSLAYLQLFPIDLMKVDRSFVSGLGQDPKAMELVRAVINLSHALGMTTLAEGVETIEQLTVLQQLGCSLGQGFGFACPMPQAELIAALQDNTLTMACPGPVQALRQRHIGQPERRNLSGLIPPRG